MIEWQVNPKSWHWWVYSKVEDDWHPSVCKYLGVIIIGAPLTVVGIAFSLPIVLPILGVAWAFEKLDVGKKLKLPHFSCPLGKVRRNDDSGKVV